MLSKLEKQILAYISNHELNISKRPFLEIADSLGIKENDLVRALQELQRKGIIKSLRAVIDHIKAGYEENALICWRIAPDALNIVKKIFIENDLISHCYEREPHKDFDYNIFTMMHAKEKEEIEAFVIEVAKTFTIDYVILFTEEELKKERLSLGEIMN